MICNTCGSETPEQGIFCTHCGARVNKECTQCAELIKFRAKVCRFCGYKFTEEEMMKEEEAEQFRISRIQSEKEQKKEEQELINQEGKDLSEDTIKEEEEVKFLDDHPKPIFPAQEKAMEYEKMKKIAQDRDS